MTIDYHPDLFAQARRLIPGGVNSPVRAFQAVGGSPVYFKSAQGAYLMDVDNRQYIDYVGGFGPAILGHAHPDVVSACVDALSCGMTFGACHPLEITMAEKIISMMPSIEMVRLVNSGTEAAMSAVRLARAATGRTKIVKFSGGYHGHVDALLVSAGSGATTLGCPSSPGIPSQTTQNTLLAEYNDLASIQSLFDMHAGDIAAVLIEPISGNMGLVLPEPGFLSSLASLCKKYGSLLVFDEVMTGFRVALGGAQSLYDCQPDLTILGKVIGGGLPVGAIGGKSELMSLLAPTGPVSQAGTLSGNPITCASGLATLSYLERDQQAIYSNLSDFSCRLTSGMQKIADRYEIPFTTSYAGGMLGFFFTHGPVRNYNDACQSNPRLFQTFFHAMMAQGVYFAPSAYEAGFVSIMHTDIELEHTLDAVDKAFQAVSQTFADSLHESI
ncbi:MAG: glutamate-1-semialdehyde 2,1-aminomutase [Pseudomonadota bacterium]|nr:glutamate-1-semialdehyde 2,1-aminomutase [Pseudomonadota bacterium]